MHKPTAIPPYWERFPSFFAYPFQLEPLLCLGLLSAGFWLLHSMFNGGLIVTILDILLFAGLLRYAFKVLERTAAGHLHARDDDLREHVNTHPYRPYKQFVALAIGAALIMMVGTILGQVMAILASIVLMLVLPASIMVLALTDDLSESINPEELLRVIGAIGTPYLGVWACLFLLSSSGAAASAFLLPVLPHFIQPFLFFMINMYFVIVMYQLMGYVLYQYHESLDLDVGIKPETTQIKNDSQQMLAQAGGLVRAGRVGDAVSFLAGATLDQPQDLALREGYFRLLLASEMHRAELAKEADRYMGVLLNLHRESQALRVLESVQQHIPQFLPTDGQTRVVLGRAALAAHKHELAIKLIKEFDMRFPRHPGLPEVMLIGARLASEHLRNDAQALKILQVLLERFPTHAIRAEAEQLQTVIARLQ